MAQLWLRGAAYKQKDRTFEEHGVAVYASETLCKQHEEQPMFIIPLNCGHASELLVPNDFLTLRLGTMPVPLTAHEAPET